MELLKSIVVDFCLFSLIEGYIFCLFFEKIGGCKKFKWYEIILFSLLNSIVSILFKPMLYQLIGLLYMTILIYIKNNLKINKCFIIALFASLYLLILEMGYSMVLSLFFNINSAITNKLILFIIIIPLRSIEFLIIKSRKGCYRMKWWIGEIIK